VLSAAIAASLSPVVVVDAADRVVRCSRAAAQLLGQAADDLEGRIWSDPLVLTECRLSRQALFDRGGRRIGAVLTLVGADDLTDAREQSRRKDEFLAVLAHELRNPLAPLRNAVQLARIGAADANLRSLLAMMERQTAALTALVEDLMDVGRIGSGKIPLAAEPVALADLLVEACDEVRARVSPASHPLLLDLCADACVVRGDRSRLRQVFVNLLHNAEKYSDAGSAIRVGLRRDGAEAVVIVQDAGVGLAAHELQDIFDLYSQVRLHQARAQGGLGIGLALVRQLVELQGGRVCAASEGPGHGSRFTVTLPLLEAAGER